MKLRPSVLSILLYFPKSPPETRASLIPGWKDPPLRLEEGIPLPPSLELVGLVAPPSCHRAEVMLLLLYNKGT